MIPGNPFIFSMMPSEPIEEALWRAPARLWRRVRLSPKKPMWSRPCARFDPEIPVNIYDLGLICDPTAPRTAISTW